MIPIKLPYSIIYDDKANKEVLELVITSQGIKKEEEIIVSKVAELLIENNIDLVVIKNIEYKNIKELKYQLSSLDINFLEIKKY